MTHCEAQNIDLRKIYMDKTVPLNALLSLLAFGCRSLVLQVLQVPWKLRHPLNGNLSSLYKDGKKIVRGRTVRETLSHIFIFYQEKMCPTRFTLVRTPPEERPYNSHRMCLAWSFLTVWLIRFMAMTSQTEIDGLWRHITRLGRLVQVHLHEHTSHPYIDLVKTV